MKRNTILLAALCLLLNIGCAGKRQGSDTARSESDTNGPEYPEVDERIGTADTLGISLRPEYSVFSTDSSTASFVLLNQGDENIMCGEHYSVTYEDEKGVWRALPINGGAIDIGYIVLPGRHCLFKAHLYPDVHPNRPGRYRFFYNVSLELSNRNILMMTEFRLTDNKEEVQRAVRMEIPGKPDDYGARFIPAQETQSKGDKVYQVVDNMPEFPGGMQALMDSINDNIQYPAEARKKGIQGKVLVQFFVDEEGYITEPNIIKSVELSLDEEALRVIKTLPQWKPGTLRGKAVKIKYTVPVVFKIDK